SCDSLATRRPSALLQRLVDPRASVGASALRVHGLHLLDELRLVLRARGRLTAPRRVEPAARNPELLAHEADGEVSLLRVDEAKLHFVSFAKKAAAFFRKSRSILRTRFSSSRRFSFARSS